MRIRGMLAGAAGLVVLGLAAFRVFAQQPPVILGADTTFITAPLAEDGLPDYSLAIVEQSRAGVTTEGNAAVLLWQALGPANVNQEQYELVCRELSVAPPTSPFLVDVRGKEMVRQVALWIRSQPGDLEGPAGKTADVDPVEDELLAAEDLLEIAGSQPWTLEQAPILESWLAENGPALDLVVAAAERPHFYSPPPNWLVDRHTPVLNFTLPLEQNVRTAVRALTVRAMYRIAAKDYEGAWSDILACWRLGGRFEDSPHLVAQLVGFACRGVAAKNTLTLLQVDGLPGPLAERILRDLIAQPARFDVHGTLHDSERLSFLDVSLRMITGRLGGIDLGGKGERPPVSAGIDPNIVLRISNEWYDRLSRAADLPTRAARDAALAEFDAAIFQLSERNGLEYLWAVVSSAKRSEAVAEVLVCLMLPATGALVSAQDRDQTNLELAQIAAALAVFKSKQGRYPTALQELQPDILANIPQDIYSNAQPPRYERRGDGYLLYSLYENEADDGGSSLDGEIANGEWLAPDERLGFDTKPSDLVIRVPRPRVDMPKLAEPP